ncbi:MAG TPA: hypothetical protein VMX97_04810, partial [Hyphomicrobiaceae bacterium]|nr:hypothetical protein [Hyphomicrobiaceae bacterium]
AHRSQQTPLVSKHQGTPQLRIEQAWARAPQFDDEHPEELSYRPFPIGPLLTSTSSNDDPVLARLVHPDSARTLEMMGDDDNIQQMRMRPGQQLARMMWAQAFSGRAISLEAMFSDHAQPPPQTRAPGLQDRRVRTSDR